MLEEVFSIFEPGLKHLVDERERQRLEIVRPGDGAPPFGVDLDSGVVDLDWQPPLLPGSDPAPAPSARGLA